MVVTVVMVVEGCCGGGLQCWKVTGVLLCARRTAAVQ